jgi:energy-converting hydrogenase A subunit R
MSKNDNAFEITSQFIPNGNSLFTIVSRYDDVLADVLKRPGYKAGDTLKLILPFLKAYGVTDQKMLEFSAQSLLLISNIMDALYYVQNIAYTFIVSTSYEHYIKALCHALSFPFENTYCTKVNIDKYKLSKKEEKRLKELAKEISQMPIFKIPLEARSLNDFPKEHQKIIQRLDEIFWKEIANMEIGKIFDEVNPVGGSEKAEAIKDVTKRLGIELADVMYVGDSITDVEAFRLVRAGGGLATSFNGNAYAVREAEIAVMSDKALVTAVLADVFSRFGKKEVMKLISNWSRSAIEKFDITTALKNRFLELCNDKFPVAEAVKPENMERLAKESTAFRKHVRGEAIGRLG